MLIANSLNICFNRFPETALLPRLAAAGYAGADFNFWDLAERLDWHDPAVADPWLDALAGAAAVAGMRWVQAHGPVFSLVTPTQNDQRQQALVLPCLRACARLGVPWVVLHPSTLRCAADDAEARRVLLEANIAYFRSLLPACEQHGVGLAIENITRRPATAAEEGQRFPGATAEELCAIIDAVNHPLVGACWDTGHAQLSGVDQRRALAMLGGRVQAVHLHENDGQGDLHLLPFTFEGAPARWEAILSGLQQAGYRGSLTFEVAAAFRALPDDLFDDVLRYSVKIGDALRARLLSQLG